MDASFRGVRVREVACFGEQEVPDLMARHAGDFVLAHQFHQGGAEDDDGLIGHHQTPGVTAGLRTDERVDAGSWDA